MDESISGFIAYPSEPVEIGDTIELAIRDKKFAIDGFRTWKAMDIAGRFIADEIQENIASSKCLVADITELNFNVTYEVGYAIGSSKRVLLTRNTTVAGRPNDIQDVGIYDTLGYREYQNAAEFAEVVRSVSDLKAIEISYPINKKTPVYLNQAKQKNDWVRRLNSKMKKSKVSYRSFDPSEQPRLSALDAIQNVSQSLGVLVHLVPTKSPDGRVHNLRAAFIAGLADGMRKPLYILESSPDPVPLDYRDRVIVCQHPNQIDEAVGEFIAEITERLQEDQQELENEPTTLLERLNLGASSAENEFRDLAAYYLQTDGFGRVLRGETRLVVGRKGSGKTAIFFQVRDRIRKDKENVVVDLKPDGYQLVKFKESVLKLLDKGTLEHVITAFWEYLLLLEVCNKLLEDDRNYHKRNHRLFEPYRRLEERYQSDKYVAEGDFAERMSHLMSDIAEAYKAKYGTDEKTFLSTPEVTDLIYKHDVKELREELESYLRHKKSLWILFDNVDKGWPTHGLKNEDIIVIRTLLDATRKLERSFNRDKLECRTVVFLRNDVFELLVDETPDRGKEARVVLDWTDADALKEVLRRRLAFSGLPSASSFDGVWRAICVPHIGVEESSGYLLERALMRPRWLINLVNQCRGFAVNVGHQRIEPDDVRKGVITFSSDIVQDVGLEIRDVFPEAADVLYAFIGCDQDLREQEIEQLLITHGIKPDLIAKVIEHLLWYGFLGLVKEDQSTAYIFDVQYNMKLLLGLKSKMKDKPIVFRINQAFCAGLEIQQTE